MNRLEGKKRREKRVRSKIRGTAQTPRLSVFRSNKYIYAQIIDDVNAKTLVAIAESEIKDTKGGTKDVKVSRAAKLGEQLAQKALKKKISSIIFDRGSFKYHGRVKAFAEGARKGGLKF